MLAHRSSLNADFWRRRNAQRKVDADDQHLCGMSADEAARVMSGFRRSPLVGIVFIFAFTWSVGLALAAQSRGLIPAVIPSVAGLVIGYLVVAGAIVATALQERRSGVRALLLRFLIWRVAATWYAVALLAFPLLYFTAVAVYAVSTGAAPEFGAPPVTRFVPAGLSLLVVAPAWMLYEMFTNGEEIGWRGYLLPRVQSRYSPLVATLIVAAVWAAWHFPKFLVVPATYNYPLWLWLVDIGAKAVLATWVFNHANGSLLLTTLLHASWNTAALCLPVLPTAHGDAGPFTVAVALTAMAAIGVIVRDPQLGFRTSTPMSRGSQVPAGG